MASLSCRFSSTCFRSATLRSLAPVAFSSRCFCLQTHKRTSTVPIPPASPTSVPCGSLRTSLGETISLKAATNKSAAIQAALKKLEDIAPAVGNTPLLRISYRYKGQKRALYSKYEAGNLSGSIKDRVALGIIKQGYETGALQPGDIIAEVSSGNTAISFAAIGTALGHPVKIFLPEWLSMERKALIRMYGADLRLVSRAEGGFLGALDLCKKFAKENPRVFQPAQFDNEMNTDTHMMSTGAELMRQLKSLRRTPHAFVAGVGTGGTVMGVGRAMRAMNPACSVHPLEPANSPTLRHGKKVGAHRIEGISDDFVPSICRLKELDHIVDAWDGDSIIMARALSKQLGVGVGITGGANFIGAAQLVEELLASGRVRDAMSATVVTVFADCNKKYLSTDLGKLDKVEPMKEYYWSQHIELESVQAVEAK